MSVDMTTRPGRPLDSPGDLPDMSVDMPSGDRRLLTPPVACGKCTIG